MQVLYNHIKSSQQLYEEDTRYHHLFFQIRILREDKYTLFRMIHGATNIMKPETTQAA